MPGTRKARGDRLTDRQKIADKKSMVQKRVILILVLLSFPIPYYFTIVGLFRYRFPLEPLLMIFAAYTLERSAWRLTGGATERLLPVKS